MIGLLQVIFHLLLNKFHFCRKIYYTFPMGKAMIMFINDQLLFEHCCTYVAITIAISPRHYILLVNVFLYCLMKYRGIARK